MQETITEAVYGALKQVNTVTDEDRKVFQDVYGYPVEENEDNEYYVYGEVGDFEYEARITTPEATLGYEVEGGNDDLASLISESLLTEGDVDQRDGRKVFGIVKDALDSYPKRMINGREQNYFEGSPEDFAAEVAVKIEDGLTSKGLLGKIGKLLKFGR